MIEHLLLKYFGTPPYIILFVSDKCRCSCRHCWFNEEWKSDNLAENYLTIEEYEKIAKNINKIHFLTITGGEAFLNEEIVDIVDIFRKNSIISRFDIPTAGFEPDIIIPKAEKILSMNPRIPFRIDVSLDGFEDTHNFIRQNKFLFKKAIETINQLKILRKKYSHFDLSIITTLSKFNQNEIVKFADFIEELLPDGEWMVNIARPKTRDPEAVNFDIESYEKINIILLNRIKNKNFAGDNAHRFGKWLTAKNAYRRDIITDILKNKNVKMNCSAGSLIGVIYQDGEVRPCETLPDSFGNLRDFDYSLSKIWNSPSAKNFRRKIREDNCVCTHECFLSTSILSNYSSIIGLIKKRHSLEM